MAVNYDSAVKTARLTATRDAVASGTLELQDAGGAAIVSFPLSATGGSVSGDVWTLSFAATSVAATGSGDVTQAVIRDSGGVARVTGLTIAEGDFALDNPSIVSGQTVTLGAFTITHA